MLRKLLKLVGLALESDRAYQEELKDKHFQNWMETLEQRDECYSKSMKLYNDIRKLRDK
jgi:hypothetical protein